MLWSGPPINQNVSSQLDRLDNVGQALTMMDGVTGVFFSELSRETSHTVTVTETSQTNANTPQDPSSTPRTLVPEHTLHPCVHVNPQDSQVYNTAGGANHCSTSTNVSICVVYMFPPPTDGQGSPRKNKGRRT